MSHAIPYTLVYYYIGVSIAFARLQSFSKLASDINSGRTSCEDAVPNELLLYYTVCLPAWNTYVEAFGRREVYHIGIGAVVYLSMCFKSLACYEHKLRTHSFYKRRYTSAVELSMLITNKLSGDYPKRRRGSIVAFERNPRVRAAAVTRMLSIPRLYLLRCCL